MSLLADPWAPRVWMAEANPACWSWLARPDLAPLDGLRGELVRAIACNGVLWVWQAGRCAVCGSTPAVLVLDHDHESHLCRGYLCNGCNVREPREVGVFERYRQRPPVDIVGVSFRYGSVIGGYGITYVRDAPVPFTPPASYEDVWRHVYEGNDPRV